jgi:hypothetical protein
LSPGSRFMAIGNDTGKCLLTEQAESLPWIII